MEMKINDYTLTGTPAEMVEFITLSTEKAASEAPAPEVPEAPKPAKKTRQKAVDWAKAIALRKAGWTYDAIASELHVSRQNVVNHMKTMGV
jgi:DNA-binding NarL/FixJ family response regulator